MSYQDNITQMQGAGFSGTEIQGWSDKQAVQLRQAGFSQDEVDGYQGMKVPEAGTPPVYGRVPTDKDFSNAASVILGGNDHPFYEKAVDTLKGIFSKTGVEPTEAVKASQAIPSFREIMENGGEGPQGSYLQEAGRSALSGVAEQMKGLADIQAYSKPDKPLFDIEPGTNPENYWLYQKGSAFQKWIDEKLPAQPAFEAAHPYKTGITSGIAQIPELIATAGLGMAAQGASGGYQQVKDAGASPEKAAQHAGKEGALWGVLGITDVGAFIKPIMRSAPGFMPWLAAKAAQAVRSGATFSGTNELGDYLSSQIAQSADIPIQYKPTLQRVVVNALTGAGVGAVMPTGAKRPEETTKPAQTETTPTGEGPQPPPAAPAAILSPAYHFDSDSYGLKDAKGEFVKTGFASEEEAAKAATQTEEKPQASRLEPEVVDRYKKTVSEQADKLGFNLTPEQLQNAAQRLAEAHNPEVKPERGPKPFAPPQEVPEESWKTEALEPEEKEVEAVEVKAKRTFEQKSPKNILQLAGSLGGLKDDGGELAAMDANKHFVPGYGRLVRKGGMSLDDFGRALVDRGYVKEQPTTAEILEIIRDGLNGKHTFAEEDRGRIEEGDQKKHQQAYDEDLQRHADEMGIDTKGMKREQIENALREHGRSAAAEANFMDALKNESQEAQTKYSPEGAEHANETISLEAYSEHANQGATGAERPGLAAGNEASRLGGRQGESGVASEPGQPSGNAGETGGVSERGGGGGDESDTLKKLSFAELGKKSDEWESKIDEKYEALIKEGLSPKEALNHPEVNALYEKRIAIDAAAAQKGYDGARNIFEKVLGDKAKDAREATIDSALRDIYSLTDNPSGVYFMSKYTGEAIDSPKTIEQLGKDITKMLFAKRNEGTTADFWLTMEHPASAMTREGKQKLISEGIDLAKQINEKMRDFFSESENIKPTEDKTPLLYQKSLNRGILTAVKDQQHMKLLKEVEDYLQKVLPEKYTYETTPGYIKTDEGETAYGLTDRTKNLITLSLQSPDQLVTASHEVLHSLRDMLTDKEWQTLVQEATDKKLQDHYKIDERYKTDKEEETIAHWYSDWQAKRQEASDVAKGLFDKIKDIFSNIAEKVRGLFGNASVEGIFKKIESGEVGQREGAGNAEGLAYQKAKPDEVKKEPTLGDALTGLRNTFSPTSAGEKAKQTEVSIRGSYGEAKRERAIAETALNEFARQANEMTPNQHADFYNYVEGRSKGAELLNKQFQKMADAVRDIYGRFKDILQSMPETRMMNFVTDYFTHQWAEGQDEQIKQFMNSWWQQGSSRNLKERKIPTIADGLAYGLKLAEPNPVRAVSRYVGSMSNYIASVKVLRTINNDLGGGYYADGMQPEGYAPLVGRNAERIENARVDPESGKLIPARNLHLYAPQQVADLYNAFYSKGFEDTKLGSAYMLARNAINTNTMLELGLSAYHFSTITMQSLNQDMSRLLRSAFSGDWVGVGQAIKGLFTPAMHFAEGSRLMEQYKDLADHGVDMERMAHLFAESNLRIGLDPLSNISTHGGFYKAWQRGELPALMERLKSQLNEGYGLGALKSGAEAVGRVVSDVSHPLFNVYIPAIKMSAFHDLMGDWLRQNPGASDGEIKANSIRLGDLVEDRFGEMNMENLFWNTKAKQLLGLTLRAPGWDVGLVRQVGGAGYDVYKMLKDGISGKGFDAGRLDRPLFMVGAAIVYAAINSAMTYIKTGQAPSDQKLKDIIAYATGGFHKAFGEYPERAELPGHGRELIQMAPVPGEGPLSGVIQEAENKVATLPKKIGEVITNKDWRGKPVYDPKSKNWVQRTPGVAQVAHIAKGFEPFSMEQLFEGAPEGSHLSLVERFLGVRAAGAKIVNPEGLKDFNERKNH